MRLVWPGQAWFIAAARGGGWGWAALGTGEEKGGSEGLAQGNCLLAVWGGSETGGKGMGGFL